MGQQKYRPNSFLPVVEFLKQYSNLKNGTNENIPKIDDQPTDEESTTDTENSPSKTIQTSIPQLNLSELHSGLLKNVEELKNFEVAHSAHLSELLQIDNSHHANVKL